MMRPATLSIREIAAYLQEAVGQRVAAAMAGLADAKQIGRYARKGGPEPHGATERRLREGYKVVRMLVNAYDDKTARAWLFGTNTRLDDRAPIEVLGAAIDTAAVRDGRTGRAAGRQLPVVIAAPEHGPSPVAGRLLR